MSKISPEIQLPFPCRFSTIILPVRNETRLTYFRRHIALPGEHGAWVFFLSPLLIGLFAGGSLKLASIYLIIAALAGFLIRQPVTIAVKAYSGRRSLRDLPAAQFWMVFYFLVGALPVAGLVLSGYPYVLFLAVPGIPVFVWHLYLVSKRAERRQAGVEVVASGVLALAAPAAFWVGIGNPDPFGWWLFILSWLQSAASIVYAYLRLEQRELSNPPNFLERLRIGRRSLLYTSSNLVMVIAFAITGFLPRFLPLAFLIQWIETIWGTIYPAIGWKPARIGLRQLLVSTLFTILFIITWEIL